MKKLLVLAAAAVGASVVQRRLKQQRAEQDLWSEATGGSSPNAARRPGGDAWAAATDRPEN